MAQTAADQSASLQEEAPIFTHRSRPPATSSSAIRQARPRARFRQRSRTLDQFIAWVKGSAAVVATDSAAMHIAAGFDVPTMAVFVSIDPVLRARDYPNCRVLDVRCELTDGLHDSNDPTVLREIHRIWGTIVERADLPWPALACRHFEERGTAEMIPV